MVIFGNTPKGGLLKWKKVKNFWIFFKKSVDFCISIVVNYACCNRQILGCGKKYIDNYILLKGQIFNIWKRVIK